MKKALAALALGTTCFALGIAVSSATGESRELARPAMDVAAASVTEPESYSTIAPRGAPGSESIGGLRFDLHCDGEGRVIWQDDPAHPVIRPNPQRWDDRTHLIVDLLSMRYCDPYYCRTRGTRQVEAASSEKIIFMDQSGVSETFRRSDGRYAMAMLSGGRIQVTEGTCAVEPFSGFPPLGSPHPAPDAAPEAPGR